MVPPNRPGAPHTFDKVASHMRATLTLARWRLRQTWWLLLLTCLGLVAAMITACVVPMFSAVTASSSLQSFFQVAPTRNQVTLEADTQGLSTHVIQTLQPLYLSPVEKALHAYQNGQTRLAVQEEDFHAATFPATLAFNLYATDLASLQPQMHLLAGHWPLATTPGVVEVMLTPQAAQQLHLSPGSELTIAGNLTTDKHPNVTPDPTLTLTIRLAGLFEMSTSAQAVLGAQFEPASVDGNTAITLLMPLSGYLNQLDQMATQRHTDAVFDSLLYQITWTYPLRTLQLQPGEVDDLINQLVTAQHAMNNQQMNANLQASTLTNLFVFPYLSHIMLYNPSPGSYQILDLLQQYTSQRALVNVPVSILALQIIALLLFIVCLLLSMLVERQLATNALLSSRGANERQLFWSLFLQGMGICFLGTLLGLLISITLVRTTILHILPASAEALLQQTIGQSGSVLALVSPFAGGTLLVALLASGLLIQQTAALNTLSWRREAARATRKPFWQRYYFDTVAAVIALSGFAVSLYTASIARQLDFATQELLIAPLTLVAPVFLLLGVLLLSLRLFPWLLTLSARLARRNPGVTVMLPMVQMARSPQPALRMTLMLALSLAFALFAQTFSASQIQRSVDIAAYTSGADFSGSLPYTLTDQPASTIQTIAANYRNVPGVTATSVGFLTTGTTAGPGGNEVDLNFLAVDAQSFAQTSSQVSRQSLAPLLTELSQLADRERQSLTLPVAIDQSIAQTLNLQLGAQFGISLSSLSTEQINFQVRAIVAQIPSAPGGVLASYSAFQQLFPHSTTAATATPPAVPLNYIWLDTRADAQSLAAVRAALTSSQLGLNNLYDRRMIISELQSEPLSFNLLIILSVGSITAFVLAFLGNIIASWLSVYTRRDSFVVLRALGATSRQIITILLWEQALIYLGALLLGVAFGILLSITTIPTLVFTGLPKQGPMSEINVNAFYLLQHAIPTQIVFPISLDFSFFALVLICALALGIMIRAVLHPSISNELRLTVD
jgi:ABC-type lipoprotein release transport system permease subunit